MGSQRGGIRAAVLTHRGPDDAGVWVDEPLGLALGHRRLSIVDLSPAAAQAALIARLQRTLDEADPGSAAYVAAAKQTQAALDRYHELRRSEEKPARTAADYTPAEWREQLDTSAREMTDPDLEVFVAEWLRRKRLVLRARADGELEIGRAGAA